MGVDEKERKKAFLGNACVFLVLNAILDGEIIITQLHVCMGRRTFYGFHAPQTQIIVTSKNINEVTKERPHSRSAVVLRHMTVIINTIFEKRINPSHAEHGYTLPLQTV